MKPRARHTSIIETIATKFGTLVREDYRGYPKDESNLYLVDSSNNILWFAQRAMTDDSYANVIIPLSTDSIKCFSAKGLECEIDLNSGKLLKAELIR